MPPFSPELVTHARFVMGTVCEITASNDRSIESAFVEASRIERELLSTWKNESELARLNARGTAEVSPELWQLLAVARAWSEKTGGAFNPLVRPLIDCWQTRGAGAVPTASALAAARSKTALGNLALQSPRTVALLNGGAIEEGAFGKGYALDRMLRLFDEEDSTVLNFGGQIAVKGRAMVAVADPRERERAVAQWAIENASLSTSSGSEKSFVAGGRTFSHLLDPRTGEALPPRGSVSVIARNGLDADILSTALYVMGSADGLPWSDAHGVASMFIDTDGSIQRSKEFRRVASAFSILDSHFHIKE